MGTMSTILGAHYVAGNLGDQLGLLGAVTTVG